MADEMNKHCVYITTSPTGRYYIGKGGTAAVRDGKYKGSGVGIKRSFEKHGKENHITLIASTHATDTDAYQAEIDLIRLWGAVADEHCLNMKDGGQGLTSQDAKNMWADPNHRAKHKRAVTAPENRALLSEKAKEWWVDSGYRARVKEGMKKLWTDHGYRARQKKAQEKVWADPVVKSRLSESQKKVWARPEYRALQSAKHKEAWADSDRRSHQSEKSKEVWARPEYRALQSKSRCKTWIIHDTFTGRIITPDNMKEYCDTHRWNYYSIKDCKRKDRPYKGRYRINIYTTLF